MLYVAEKDRALEAFCKLQAQRQFSINNLRSDLRSLLEEMGNQIIPVENQVNELYKAKLKEAGEVIDQRHCEAVAGKELIDKRTYQERQTKDYLSLEEFQECEKFRIWDSYGKEVTPELVKKDQGGRLLGRLIALEEILEPTEGMVITEDGLRAQPAPPTIVAERDILERDSLPLCFHWRNRSATWLARHKLGLIDLVRRLIEGGEISARSEDAISLTQVAVSCAQHVKAILGVTIPPLADPIW